MPPDDAIAADGGPVFGMGKPDRLLHSRNVFPEQQHEPPALSHDGPLGHRHQRHVVGRNRKSVQAKRNESDAGRQRDVPPGVLTHYDGNCKRDSRETIVQIMGYGPVSTVQVEEDEKGNPMTKGGEGAGYAASPPPK